MSLPPSLPAPQSAPHHHTHAYTYHSIAFKSKTLPAFTCSAGASSRADLFAVSKAASSRFTGVGCACTCQRVCTWKRIARAR